MRASKPNQDDKLYQNKPYEDLKNPTLPRHHPCMQFQSGSLLTVMTCWLSTV